MLRPVWFMENWETPAVRDSILGGTLAQPLSPDRPFQQIAVNDVGAFATMVLLHRDEWLGRAIDLAGDERPISEVAQTFGRVIGRPVQYVQVSRESSSGRPPVRSTSACTAGSRTSGMMPTSPRYGGWLRS